MAAAYGADEGLGLGWIAIGLLGFAVGYLVPKVKPLTDAQTVKLGTWVPSIVAAVVAFRPDPAIDNGLIGIAGRAAIFGLVWLYFGVIFAFGLKNQNPTSPSLPNPPNTEKHPKVINHPTPPLIQVRATSTTIQSGRRLQHWMNSEYHFAPCSTVRPHHGKERRRRQSL